MKTTFLEMVLGLILLGIVCFPDRAGAILYTFLRSMTHG